MTARVWILAAMIFGTWLALSFPNEIGGLAPGLQPAFAVTMLAVGLMVEPDDLRTSLRAPGRPLIGLLTQYTVMPLLAYVVSLGFDDPALRVGIVLVGCVPGAMASNVMTLLFRGDLVLSVTLTTLATLVCPLVLSFWLPLLADTRMPVDVAALAWNALWMVVAPVAFGMAVRGYKPPPRAWLRPLPLIAGLAIVLIVMVVVANNSARLVDVAASVALGMLALNLGGYAVAYGLARALAWPPPARRTLVIEVGMQNAGLGSVLAQTHIGPTGAVPAAFYTALCIFTTAVALPWAARRIPRTQPTGHAP